MADVKLVVNGVSYGGWKTVEVTRGIEACAGGFRLGVSERWSGQNTPWPISEGQACSVLLNNETVITGFIDKRKMAYGSSEHSVSVEGRDATGDLVDCSVNLGAWEFGGVSLEKFAKLICGQFGIPVTLQSGMTLNAPPPKFTVSPGDTAFDTLEKACKHAGVLPVSDGKGGLLLTQSSSYVLSTALVEGGNILSAESSFDTTGRFRRYIVLGQAVGTDDWFGEGPTRVKASSEDQNITRTNRVLVVRPEGAVSAGYAKRRAEWEAVNRAAKGDSVAVTVQGWTTSTGALWPVNQLVHIQSPRIGVNGDMLITQAVYSVDDKSGTTTKLTLKRPDAFKPEPVITKASNIWKEIAGGV